MFFKNYDAKIECAEHRCKQKSTNLSHFPDENGLNNSPISIFYVLNIHFDVSLVWVGNRLI